MLTQALLGHPCPACDLPEGALHSDPLVWPQHLFFVLVVKAGRDTPPGTQHTDHTLH